MEPHNNKRIAKNTLLLYVRMAVTMAVQLYTSRIVLEVLGIDDYGIWNLIATLIISITFITNPLTSAVQRFLNFAIGENDTAKIQQVFSQSIILFSSFAIILLIILESAGLWFLNYKLNIPPEKIGVGNVVFQFSIASFLATLIRLPYDSMIIAYEKFNFYAYVSILEVFLKLVIVYLIRIIISIQHLVLYSILTFTVSISIALIYKIYCNKDYPTSRILFKLNRGLLKEIASFSGWSFLGAFAVMMSNQGVGIVLNMFFGVVVNAAMGITNQVGNAVNQFVSNFQVAFRPQIVKTYAQKDLDHLKKLINRTTKFSFLLIFMIVFPLIHNMNYVLHLWLGDDIPPYTAHLSSWFLLCILIESISAPLWMTIQASGNIKKYQLIISTLFILNIIFSYILLSLGLQPVCVMYVRLIVSLLCYISRLLIVNYNIKLTMNRYFMESILPIVIVSLISGVFSYLYINLISIDNEFLNLLLFCFLFFSILLFSTYFIVFDKSEKNFVKDHITGFIWK